MGKGAVWQIGVNKDYRSKERGVMANTFWIKLYIQILDDPKMGALSDRLYRRAIEMFLMAGEIENKGHLPSEKDIAWRLRVPFDILHEDITLLIENNILEILDTGIHVKNFEKWQGEIPAKVRAEAYRDRKWKRLYNGNETECDADKIRIDKNRENKIKRDAQNIAPVDPKEMEEIKERLKTQNPIGYSEGINPLKGI